MRRRLVTFAMIAGIIIACAGAKDDAVISLRDRMQALVSAGNRAYDLSDRRMIRLYADSLQTILADAHACNLLSTNDSLEFEALRLKLMGDWHYEFGGYDPTHFKVADSCFKQALATFRRASNDVFETDLRCVPMLMRDMAQLRYRVKQYKEAEQYLDTAFSAYDVAYMQCFMTDRQESDRLEILAQLAMCQARTGNYAAALENIESVLEQMDPAAESYYETLRKYAKIIYLQGGENSAGRCLLLYRRYMDYRRSNVAEVLESLDAKSRTDYWMRMRPFVADCYLTRGADPAFLYDVTLFAKGLLLRLDRKGSAGLECTWRDVQQKLDDDACAIEFVQYGDEDDIQMAALVLRNSGAPMWVPMVAPDVFLNTKPAGGKHTNSTRICSRIPSMRNALYESDENARLIWSDALIEAIGPCKKIYFAPDGYLHQLAIEYMLPAELAGRELHRLSSTRVIIDSAAADLSSALVIGGIDYDCELAEPGDFRNDGNAYRYIKDKGITFRALQYSQAEVDYVMASRRNPQDVLLSGQFASESRFRDECGCHPVVSISTHGRFDAARVPQGTDIKPCLEDNSLSQSVLLLAGANHALADLSFVGDEEDGILSALELSELDMSGVSLGVLSACQTGLGYVTADGVYGMQRGLKAAGVKSILVSLWEVNDKAASIFMSEFHTALAGGAPAAQALKAAAGKLQKAGFDAPCFTHAFILIDAI